MPKDRIFFYILPIFCASLLILYFSTYIKVRAEQPSLQSPDSADANLLQLSASWDGTQLQPDGTTSVPLNQAGTLGWTVQYDAHNSQLEDYLPQLANAVYTVQLFKGEAGNSSLVWSATIPGLATSTTGAFPMAFPGAGHYMLAYTATYPDGTYPLDVHCGGDICRLQKYSLQDYQTFMTRGQFEDSADFGNPVPALYGLEEFTLALPAGPTASNVLFIPGTMESRLYLRDAIGHEEEVWEPTHDANVSALAFDDTGESHNKIYTRDVVDYLYSNIPPLGSLVHGLSQSASTLYGPFESFLDSLTRKGVITAWQAYPYDWRYDVTDIIRTGTLVATATSTPELVRVQDVLHALASSSPTGKVTIVAHSNGGLLAKALAVDLEQSGNLSLIDRIIMVGTPQVGTPSAIGSMLHGDGQTRALGLVTKGSTIREVGEHLPGPYDLLPDAAYFSYISTPVVSFEPGPHTTPYATAYGDTITTEAPFLHFLTDAAQSRLYTNSNDLRTPATLSSGLLTKAIHTHDAIDTWVPPNSLQLISIAGMGQLTPSGYTYMSNTLGIEHTPAMTSQGDNTVVSISAASNPGERFYFDTQGYKVSSGVSVVHQSLLSAVPIQQQITDLLQGDSTVAPYLSTTTPKYNIVPEVVVSAHSPVTLLATNARGDQTGMVLIPNTDFSIIKEDIPGSSVQTVDDEKYMFLPKDGSYKLSFSGYDSGTTTIEIGELDANGDISEQVAFSDIPTNEHTSGSFSVTNGIPSQIAVDENNDGEIDRIVASSSPVAPPANSAVVQPTSSLPTRGSSGDTATNSAYLLYLQLTVELLRLELDVLQVLHIRLPIPHE